MYNMELTKSELEKLNDVFKTVDYGELKISVRADKKTLDIDVSRHVKIDLDEKENSVA
jgi:hypothetical protein